MFNACICSKENITGFRWYAGGLPAQKEPSTLLKDLTNIKAAANSLIRAEVGTSFGWLPVIRAGCSSKREPHNLSKLTTNAACRFLGRLCLPKSHSYLRSWPELWFSAPAFWCGGQGIRDHTHTQTQRRTHTTSRKKTDIFPGISMSRQ